MRRWTLYSLLIIALLAAVPLWGAGIINTRGGGDSPFLLQRTMEMAEALRDGVFPPRWMSHAAYDLGYPFFNHYAALPYYLSGGLTALGISPIVAIQATQTLGFILAAFTIGLWTKRCFQSRAALFLSVVAYTFAPFHMVNVYVRGDSLSEFYAFIWYPLILWTLDKVIEKPTHERIAGAALTYAALILTHNVSALIFSPFALLYVFLHLIKRWRQGTHPRRLVAWGILWIVPFILGIALTTWFWLPAIGETGYGQMGPEFTAGYFHYSNHFRGLNLIQHTPAFDYSITGDTDGAGPFSMGLVQAILAVAGAVLLLRQLTRYLSTRKGSFKPSILYTLLGLGIATLMITPLSELLWEHIPLLETTQFPWRFLSVQALFTAISTGALGEWISERNKDALSEGERPEAQSNTDLKHGIVIILCGLLIVAALVSLNPDRLLINTDDVNWDTLRLYETFTGNIGTTIRYEYLPQDVVPRLYISEALLEGQGYPTSLVDAALTYTYIERRSNRQVWDVKVEADKAPVTFPLNWWPGWQADVDGQPVTAYPMVGSGRLTVNLMRGEHRIVLHLEDTPLRRSATLISLITGFVSLIWLLYKAERDTIKQTFRQIAQNAWTYFALPFAIAFVLCLALNQPVSEKVRAFDFLQMPYPHAGPVDFGEAQLTAVSVPTSAIPGKDLTFSMHWAITNPTPLTATVRLVSPAVPRHGVPYTLAETKIQVTPSTTITLPLPGELSRGLYLIALHLHNAEGEVFAKTAQGHTMGVLYIGELRVLHGPEVELEEPLIARLGEGSLLLHTMTAEQPGPETLLIRPSWSTPGTPQNWSLSVRLTDVTGKQIMSKDLQPGYGYLPTTLWLPGEKVTDHLRLNLPPGLAPGRYTLKLISYLEATMDEGGSTEIPITLSEATLREPCNFCDLERRAGKQPCEAAGIQLRRVELPDSIQEGESLNFKVEWWAVSVPSVDLTARWEIIDGNGNAIATEEGPLAPGSQTSTWPRYTWARTAVHLDLPPTLPDGPYYLQVKLLAAQEVRNSCDLMKTLPIIPRSRQFELSFLPYLQEASFEEQVYLLGYDWQLGKDMLDVTLWWKAGAETPQEDYKRFVHLVDTSSGNVAAQDDAMPRGWTYPTSWWAPGEIVSETLTLDVGAVQPGKYRVAVGWYNDVTGDRLEISNAAGTPQADDRLFLDSAVLQKP